MDEKGKLLCFEEELVEQYARKLKACGHPVRLKLLCLIATGEEPCVSDLWTCLEQPQPVVSQHLAVLKEHGIVRADVKGNKRTYSLIDPFVKELLSLILTREGGTSMTSRS
ncbi:regulatory protein ArsR [Spirochaeta thermophila DSM 6578]|uniref:Regulatory protein ArsR n=1 Tax=Winmispira thermophila (strain ATCC 700085 / DSM 6578 / Z-1203) TaxID=869211 RepID=G0GB89_WINT7|nr:metalloregulator ArsR/SmtB family transcription factor [Spirochaeta thermophila]AEJ61898.1 regulatory protein ArsR [Spirochaeta thermophila DSM 6578]